MIKVAVIGENEAIQQQLRHYLNTQKEVTCVFNVPTVAAFQQIAAATPVDCIVITVTDDSFSTVAQVRKLKRLRPESVIIVLTENIDEKRILAWLRAGVVGYLPKNIAYNQLKEAIMGTLAGGAYIAPVVVRKILNFFRSQDDLEEVLTIREKEIVQCLIAGMSYKLMSDKLQISIDTVRYHLRNIYKKLHVNSKSQVISKAMAGEIIL